MRIQNFRNAENWPYGKVDENADRKTQKFSDHCKEFMLKIDHGSDKTFHCVTFLGKLSYIQPRSPAEEAGHQKGTSSSGTIRFEQIMLKMCFWVHEILNQGQSRISRAQTQIHNTE